jgi:hypothetical protein
LEVTNRCPEGFPPILPADHVVMLHPPGRRGVATVARGGKRWQETAVPIADLPAFVADIAGQPDVFIAQQSFFGWRRIAKLAQLGAAYVDLDFHRTQQWGGTSPEGVTWAVFQELDNNRIPAPSFVLSTGRGLLVLWLHGLVPRSALPRWMAVQKRLAQILAPIGADHRALDAARVFRLAGTENSRARTIVRPTYLAAAPHQLWRWDFEELAREVLPRERADIIGLGVRRAERRAGGSGPPPALKLTAASYWEAVLTDLQRLRETRWFGPLPSGQRDTWLFLAGCAMSWLVPPTALRRELYALAQEAGGWDEREANSRMSSVFRRAEIASRAVALNGWVGPLTTVTGSRQRPSSTGLGSRRPRCATVACVCWSTLTASASLQPNVKPSIAAAKAPKSAPLTKPLRPSARNEQFSSVARGCPAPISLKSSASHPLMPPASSRPERTGQVRHGVWWRSLPLTPRRLSSLLTRPAARQTREPQSSPTR